MSDTKFVEVSFENGKLAYTQELMDAMWEPAHLIPYPVDGTLQFDYKGSTYGIVDLLCYMDELKQDLREKGPEAIIESVLELINTVYIGDESLILIGRTMDIYGVELNERAGIVFRTIIMDSERSVEEMLALREVGMTLFPVPSPE